MLLKKMLRTNFLTLSAFFSIICHLICIQFFETYKKKNEERDNENGKANDKGNGEYKDNGKHDHKKKGKGEDDIG